MGKLNAGPDTRWAGAPETVLDQPRRWVPLKLKVAAAAEAVVAEAAAAEAAAAEAAAAEARLVRVQVAEEVLAHVLPGGQPEERL